jgi:tRNA-Thr(GGU) m(6)t(6)A37 methyltransferase TsaA
MARDDDAMQPVTLHPIGVIRTPHQQAVQTPIQPVFARGIEGRVEVLPQYVDGLRDLEGFSHVWLIYWLHKASAPRLMVTPFLDDTERGVFATRAPCRPNPIGLSLVRLQRCEGNVLHIEDVDMLDGTPLLDIKPYAPRFDCRENVRSGWLDGIDEQSARRRGRREYPGNNEDG